MGGPFYSVLCATIISTSGNGWATAYQPPGQPFPIDKNRDKKGPISLAVACERYRQYGLWEPAVEITFSDDKAAHTLRVGSPTTDGKGLYCVVVGRNKVYVTTPEAVRILSADLSVYRQEVSKQANP